MDRAWHAVRSFASTMRMLVCLVSMVSLAAADERVSAEEVSPARVSFGAAVAVAKERALTGIVGGEVRVAVRGLWLVAAFGAGDAGYTGAASEGERGGRAYEARAGVLRLACGAGARACGGFGGSVGYVHASIDFEDPFDPVMWTEVRDLAFGELRGLGRLQLGPAALEASIGVRMHAPLHREHAEGGVTAGVVVGLGLHLAL